MAIVPIIKSLYPKVPAVAGVPSLLRSGAQVFDTLTFGLFGASSALASLIGKEVEKWAVRDQDGKKIAEYNSVLSMEYQNASEISNYQMEMGSFASYNKVATPFRVFVELNCSGTEAERNDFISTLNDAQRGRTLYTIYMEDAVFRNCNLVDLGISRTAENGAHRIEARCLFQEVRLRGASAFSSPKIPSAAVLKDQGQLQPIPDTNIDTSGVV